MLVLCDTREGTLCNAGVCNQVLAQAYDSPGRGGEEIRPTILIKLKNISINRDHC